MNSFYRALCIVLVLSSLANEAAASEPSIRGWSRGLYLSLSGIWDRTDEILSTPRHEKIFSWGAAFIRSNWGLIVDLDEQQPYITHYGDKYIVMALHPMDDGSIIIDLKDESAHGAFAFTQLLFHQSDDGTALVDFRRGDGSLYGAFVFTRSDGPGTK